MEFLKENLNTLVEKLSTDKQDNIKDFDEYEAKSDKLKKTIVKAYNRQMLCSRSS